MHKGMRAGKHRRHLLYTDKYSRLEVMSRLWVIHARQDPEALN